MGVMHCALAHGATISDIAVELDAKAQQTKAIIKGQGFDAAKLSIFEINDAKHRVVVDCKDCTFAQMGKKNPNGQHEIIGQGTIQRFRMAQRNSHDVRLVLDLDANTHLKARHIAPDMISFNFSGEFLVNEKLKSKTKLNNTAQYRQDAANASLPVPRIKPRPHVVSRRPVIVIDPGHGGYDPGAIGVKGTREKMVTLKAAIELRDRLKESGRYKVIMTRDSDRYVKHEERLRLARVGGADLFISIHADSASQAARGASVYTLASRAKGRSKRVIDSQNWIMDVDLTSQSDQVGDILVDLAQRKTFSQSTLFADILINHLKPVTSLVGNTHRQAGYYVLLAPDVPAVLLELGFISNQDDEKLLNSSKHRQKVIQAATQAINSYFDSQKS